MLKRVPTIWTPGARDGRIVLLDASGLVAWETADDETLLEAVFQWSQASRLLAHIEVVTARMVSHEKAQPAYAVQDQKLAARTYAIAADAFPRPDQRRELLQRDRQLDIWRRAA